MTGKPLAGVRVLDLSWIGVGCIATWLLADLGAEVIKVEPPDGSDNLRTLAPHVRGVGINHLVFDRHKRSLAVNLRTEEGREAYRAVVASADAVIEGMRTGVADRLGIGYSVLRESNAGLTYVTLPGYGAGGPLSAVAGHDLNFDALAGVLSMTYPGPVGPPPVQAGDYFGATLAALAVVSGVIQGRASGQGSLIESSLFDGALFAMAIPHARALATGEDVVPERYVLVGEFACYSVYECADGGHLAVGALEPHFWGKFCELAGIDDGGHQYTPGEQDALRARVASVIGTRTRAEWVAHFGDADVCVSPVLSVAEAVRGEHFTARGGVARVRHPDGSPVAVPAGPLKVAADTGMASLPAVGEGTRELLLDAGLSASRIAELAASGNVQVDP
jgi:crotonobetainyl-CoA:carnitine CoA-transferase CaiB-like acyl-CoA transferase